MQIPAALDPVAAVKEALPDSLLDVHQFRDETTLIIKPADIVTVTRFLRDTKGLIYNYLSDISVVDYYRTTTAPVVSASAITSIRCSTTGVCASKPSCRKMIPPSRRSPASGKRRISWSVKAMI